MNRKAIAECPSDPTLLVSARGRVISANTAFHEWLRGVAPQSTATDYSAWLSGTPGMRLLTRNMDVTRRARFVRVHLRSLFDGAQLYCEGTVDGSPFERTYLIRLTPTRGSRGDRTSPPRRRGLVNRLRSGHGWMPKAEHGALNAIAGAARDLANSGLDDCQIAQLDVIQRNVDLLIQGVRRPGAALWGVETRGVDMRESRDLRVLLVEDNPVNRTVASRMLGRLGLSPDVCTNGHEAVERATAQAYDLILMDVQMPGMDGIEATYRIRELCSSRRPTRIVALTANTVDETRLACERAGMDGFLAKPFTLAELTATLNLVMDPPEQPVRS